MMMWMQKMFNRRLDRREARKLARKEALSKTLQEENTQALDELNVDLQVKRGDGTFITPKEAAEILGTNTNILQKLRAAGKGPAFKKVGTRVFYEKEDVVEYEA